MNKINITLGLAVVAIVVAIVGFVRMNGALTASSDATRELLGAADAISRSTLDQGTDYDEVGFNQVRVGKFFLTSSSTSIGSLSSTTQGGNTDRLAWVNNTGVDALVSLSDLKFVTRGQATTTGTDQSGENTRSSPGTAQNFWRIFVATSTNAVDNSKLPQFGSIPASTQLLVAGAPIYNGSSATTTTGLGLLSTGFATSTSASAVNVNSMYWLDGYGTTTIDGITPMQAPITSVIVKNGEALQVLIRQGYGYAGCGMTSATGTNSWITSDKSTLLPCEHAFSSQVGFVLDVYGTYEYKNPRK